MVKLNGKNKGQSCWSYCCQMVQSFFLDTCVKNSVKCKITLLF